MPGVPDALFGPAALLAALLFVVPFLWRAANAAQKDLIDELRVQLAKSEAREAVAIAGWRGQTDATNRIADLLERERDEARGRRRMSDSQ